MEMLHVPGWYLAYTKSSRAKKVADRFFRKKIKHYYPMKRVKREEFGHSKTIYEPLFTSYVFVHVASAEHFRIKMIHDVIGLVHWRGMPAIVRDEEIGAIKKFLEFHRDVEVEKIPVSQNDRISVLHSPIIQKEIIPEIMNDFIRLELPSIGYALKARLNRELIINIPALQLENYQQSYSENLQN